MQVQSAIGAAKRRDDYIDRSLIELRQNNLDVRVILGEYAAQGGWLDKMQAIGINLTAVRIQTGVHNKGIVVDSGVVMLSSQNWSGDGKKRP